MNGIIYFLYFIARYIFIHYSRIKILLYKNWVVKFENVTIGINNVIYDHVIIKNLYGGYIKIGNNNEFLYGVMLLTYGGKIEIGNNCSINPNTIIYGHGSGTKIGDNVLIAGQCMIIPANHSFGNIATHINKQPLISKGIIIESDVWIGSGCKILDGVTIGQGSVIAAGSVVNRSIPEYSIVVGVPGRIIKSRK